MPRGHGAEVADALALLQADPTVGFRVHGSDVGPMVYAFWVARATPPVYVTVGYRFSTDENAIVLTGVTVTAARDDHPEGWETDPDAWRGE